MRRPIIVGNWKMYKTPADARKLSKGISTGLSSERLSKTEVVLCPPFVDLPAVREEIFHSGIALGAQNLYPEKEGAFTGETSPAMLKEAGVSYVIIGHSERRQHFKESDDFINRKVLTAMQFGLKPILCVGETLPEREANLTGQRVESQLAGGLKDLPPENLASLVIAYEPVWAIGTGRNATPEQAQEVHRFIRDWFVRAFGAGAAGNLRIQYGGSVKPDNSASILGQPDIDGALVGGASLTAESFLAIVNSCGD